MSESTKPCARCHEAPRETGSYCRPCARELDRESRERIGGHTPPPSDIPCARCGESTRVSGKSYCKDCVSLNNKECANRKRTRLLEEYPNRLLPASERPCARCGITPREAKMSYCRPCHRALGRESRERTGGKKPLELCSRCGKLRDGVHSTYCADCWSIYRSERREKPCASCGKERSSDDQGNETYCYDCWRDQWLQYNYGISLDEFNEMLAQQDNRCAICTQETNGRTWHLDHSHDTNRVRLPLCDGCNKGLGHFKDSLETLRRAADYVYAFMNPYEAIWDGRNYPVRFCPETSPKVKRIFSADSSVDLPIPA